MVLHVVRRVVHKVSRVIVRPACLAHASFVLANMRDADRDEVMCQVPDGTKTHEIAYMMLMSGDAFVAYLNDIPVLFFGAHALNVCTLEAWALGTKDTRRVLHAATRYLFAEFIPKVVEAGYLSVECRSHADHHAAHRWLRSTGAVANGEPFVYGKTGEKFVIYRWDRDAIPVAVQRYRVGV